jgi:peptidoglycan/xylan/chitin deacetylase (PgdA/CDA1 family)
MLAARLGVPVRHLAYPFGDATSAGPREFALAADTGYASAVTTRPGMLYRQHGRHLTALPRLSVNGGWQSRAALEVLLSGAPFLVWNRGRRINA